MSHDLTDHPCVIAYEAGLADGKRKIPEYRAIIRSKQYEDSDGYLEAYYDAVSE
jgi:hypothetical protein